MLEVFTVGGVRHVYCGWCLLWEKHLPCTVFIILEVFTAVVLEVFTACGVYCGQSVYCAQCSSC